MTLVCSTGRERVLGSSTAVRENAERHSNELVESILGSVPENDMQFRRDMRRLAEVRKNRRAAAESYFRENAAEWDSLRSLHVDEAKVEERMLSFITGNRHQSIIDIGTGTGRILELFGQRMDRVEWVLICRMKCSRWRTRMDEAGLSTCQVRHGDMYQLPIEDESFDIATLHLVLHFADDPAAVIQEAARVMAANARLIIVDYAPHEMEELRNQHAHRRLGFSDSKVREFLSAAWLHIRPLTHCRVIH